MRFYPQDFNRATLHVLPYILLHELICHGYQSIDVNNRKRSECGDGCAWSDGWMDFATLKILKKALGDRRWATGISKPRWLRHSPLTIRDDYNTFHAARYNEKYADQRRKAQSAQQRLGREMYYRLWQAFPREGENAISENEAEERLLSFSLRLNRMDLTNEQRNHFITELDDTLSDPEGMKAQELVKVISSFLYEGDVTVLSPWLNPRVEPI
jgi:hypothetical protein